jgi:hypothetical protein
VGNSSAFELTLAFSISNAFVFSSSADVTVDNSLLDFSSESLRLVISVCAFVSSSFFAIS